MVGDAGIELMAIAAWHPFKTRRRVADLVRETICRSECQSRSRAKPATRSLRAFSAPTAGWISASRQPSSSPPADPARGPDHAVGASRRRAAFARELCEDRRRLPLSDPDRAEHGGDRGLRVGAYEAALADRGEHLQHDADRGLESEIHGWAGPRRLVERPRQVFPQTEARRFADRRIGPRRGQGQFGCHVDVDRLQSDQKA